MVNKLDAAKAAVSLRQMPGKRRNAGIPKPNGKLVFLSLGARPKVVSEEGMTQRHPEPPRRCSRNGFGTAADSRFVR